MNQAFEVLVVGGGVVGLTAALAMAKRGFSVAIVDAGPLTADLTKTDPRVYALNQVSMELLQKLGVWEQLDSSRLSPYRQMYVWDAANGAHIEFDARMIASSQLGTIIEESVLRQALLGCVQQEANIQLFPNHSVEELKETANYISVQADKLAWQAQLLMIADGANSPCRELLKLNMTSWPYHQQALVALVQTEKSHQQTAWQVFNPEGPLAFLPLNNEKLCSIVWSTRPGHANHLMSLSDEDFNQQLGDAFARKLGEVEVMGKRYQFPLTMRHTGQYSGKRWLLLGDAAHTIHPLAGLGLNVGLADVAVWLNCLEAAKNQLISHRALNAYQRQRKHAVWQVIAMMGGLKSLFANPLSPVVKLRGLGLKFCNQFSPVKRFFIEQATGVSSR